MYVLRVVKSLLDTGISLQQIRAAVVHLRQRGISDLSGITLMSDGATVYECASADEVVDLIQGGQGVFTRSPSDGSGEGRRTCWRCRTTSPEDVDAQAATDDFARCGG